MTSPIDAARAEGRGVRTSDAYLSSAEMCRRSGLSARQVDHWVRQGVLTPSVRQGWGSGARHAFGPADVLRACVLWELLAVGVEGAARLRRALEAGSGPEHWLVVHGSGAALAVDDLAGWLADCPTTAFRIVNLAHIRDEMGVSAMT